MGTEVTHAGSTGRLGQIVGDLSSLSLAEIVQMLSLGGRTGMVALTSRGHHGRVWFEAGSATHAETEEKTGESAMYQMLAWNTGRFEIDDGVCTEMRTLDCDTMLIVFEGLRRIDEETAPTETDADDRPFESPAEQVSPSKRSRHLTLATVLASGAAILLLGASFVGVASIVSNNGMASLETVDESEPPSTVLLASRKAPPDGPERFDLDRSETWMEELDLSPDPVEFGEVAGPDSKAGETIEISVPPQTIVEEPAESLVDEERSIPGREESESLLWRFPVSIEPSYVDLVVKSNVKSGQLEVAVDGQSVYSLTLKKKAKPLKRFLRKIAGQADERFETTIEIEPGPHEIVARIELHGKAVSYESRLEIDLASGGRETVQVSVGRAFGKRLAMGVVKPTTTDEVMTGPQ
jgi:hypothetical protein